MSDALTSDKGSLFIQTAPGKKPEYVTCLDLDDIVEPLGDETLIQCRDTNGDFQTVGSMKGAPGAVTTGLTALTMPESDALDNLGKCKLTLYAALRNCDRAGVFTNYVRGQIIHDARITTRTLQNVVKRADNGEVFRKLDISAWSPVYYYRQVAGKRQTIATTVPLYGLAACGFERCDDACGSAVAAGQNLITIGDAPTGSPATPARVYLTDDGGVAWASASDEPFGNGNDARAIACFQIDRTTWRWLAVREQVGGGAMQVSYSDDDGATWTIVTVGSVINEGATGGNAIFAIDSAHIWIATSAGNVYFSDDGGLTWDLQASSTATGGASMNAIQFVDTLIGFAVGDGGKVVASTDGGVTWSALADPSGGDDILSLAAFTQYRLLVGTDSDGLYQTWDAGASWETKSFTGLVGTGLVQSMSNLNAYVIFMVHNTVGSVGTAHRSIDGGHTWEKLTIDTTAKLNMVKAVDVNLAYAVGAVATTAVVLKITG
jgi:photosystem II stability/assembly factor-like uncharacterized protein